MKNLFFVALILSGIFFIWQGVETKKQFDIYPAIQIMVRGSVDCEIQYLTGDGDEARTILGQYLYREIVTSLGYWGIFQVEDFDGCGTCSVNHYFTVLHPGWYMAGMLALLYIVACLLLSWWEKIK